MKKEEDEFLEWSKEKCKDKLASNKKDIRAHLRLAIILI